jgi:hypothetical protein
VTHPRRLSTFLSILLVVLAGTVALVLALIHPGWAVRLTRYVSQSMVGGRRSRRLTGRHTSQTSVHGTRRLPASKSGGMYALPESKKADGTARQVEVGNGHPMWRSVDHGGRDHRTGVRDVPEMPGAVRDEVQSALVNLGMRSGDAGRLAKQAVRGRDFDSALRWAISNRRAA